MAPNRKLIPWVREELLHLLSVSATLSGLCITVVALMHTFRKDWAIASYADDMFAICALIFLLEIYLIFTSLRLRNAALVDKLVKLIDILFLLAMTLMTIAGFIMVYTVW